MQGLQTVPAQTQHANSKYIANLSLVPGLPYMISRVCIREEACRAFRLELIASQQLALCDRLNDRLLPKEHMPGVPA